MTITNKDVTTTVTTATHCNIRLAVMMTMSTYTLHMIITTTTSIAMIINIANTVPNNINIIMYTLRISHTLPVSPSPYDASDPPHHAGKPAAGSGGHDF